MVVFRDPTEHAENPPETWKVVKVADRCWHLTTADGTDFGSSFSTKRAAEAEKVDGFLAGLYAEETRWYAGETRPGYRSWADVAASRVASRKR